jgi:hypothetical protein
VLDGELRKKRKLGRVGWGGLGGWLL